MEGLLLRVLAVILSGVGSENLPTKSVPFDRLPPECAAVYDAGLRKLRQANATEVIEVDLDGDRVDELLIFNGNHGSGGEGWIVMRKEKGAYRKAGEVFGILHKSGRGLIVESPCGWSYADWSYYELIGGALVRKLDVEVEYGNPIRREPVRIKVEARVSEHRDR